MTKKSLEKQKSSSSQRPRIQYWSLRTPIWRRSYAWSQENIIAITNRVIWMASGSHKALNSTGHTFKHLNPYAEMSLLPSERSLPPKLTRKSLKSLKICTQNSSLKHFSTNASSAPSMWSTFSIQTWKNSEKSSSTAKMLRNLFCSFAGPRCSWKNTCPNIKLLWETMTACSMFSIAVTMRQQNNISIWRECQRSSPVCSLLIQKLCKH